MVGETDPRASEDIDRHRFAVSCEVFVSNPKQNFPPGAQFGAADFSDSLTSGPGIRPGSQSTFFGGFEYNPHKRGIHREDQIIRRLQTTGPVRSLKDPSESGYPPRTGGKWSYNRKISVTTAGEMRPEVRRWVELLQALSAARASPSIPAVPDRNIRPETGPNSCQIKGVGQDRAPAHRQLQCLLHDPTLRFTLTYVKCFLRWLVTEISATRILLKPR